MKAAGKPSVLMLLRGDKSSPREEAPTEEPDDGEGEMGAEGAMGDFILAVKSGDKRSALRAFDQLCEFHKDEGY